MKGILMDSLRLFRVGDLSGNVMLLGACKTA